MQETSSSSNSGNSSLRKLRRDWWKTRLCTSCVSPLGRIISRGGICKQCGLRVCRNCRHEIQPGSGVWVCVLCSNNGGISQDIFGKTKSLGRNSTSIRRSWSISTPQRAQTNSPVLKSYTVLHPEESGIGSSSTLNVTGSGHGNGPDSLQNPGTKSPRQFHSLPRMSSDSDRGKKAKRSFSQEFEKENIKRHRSFQSTLHPYQVPNPPSPSASINFIEDPFWDYYDYDIEDSLPRHSQHYRVSRFRSLTSGGGSASILQRRNSIRNKSDMDRLLKLNLSTNSNRSSCERSLGESVDYDFSRNYSLNYSNFSSLSDTELNDNSKYEQEDNHHHNTSLSPPRRFSTESSNFYKFATVTPLNMSPMSDPRKEKATGTHTNPNTPVKPERKCNKNKRSFSLNSYDGKKLFSPLRTYVVVMKENVVPKANNISDASITNTNVNTINPETTVENNGHNESKRSNNNTSIRINSYANLQERSRPREVEFKINNSTKFHSLPRERVIRIEREDSKFSKAKENIPDFERSKNVSKIEITRSVSSASAKDYHQQHPTISGNVTKVPIGGRKIGRSQSHREISNTNNNSAQQKVPLIIAKSFSPQSSSRVNGESVIRGKSVSTDLNQKPLLNSLLDDRNTATVMENFLRSPSQNSGGSPTRTNENVLTSSKKSDFVQTQESDFENFQRQQMQTFDNYLRQCSTFPRASMQKHKEQEEQSMRKSANKQEGFESEPKSSAMRHTTTTLITRDDNFVKSLEDLDEYFLPRGNLRPNRAKSEMQLLNPSHQHVIDPTYEKGVEVGPGWTWSATLPHPYIRRHKQQKSSFIQQPKKIEKEKTRINDVEREIERDICFQKTKSLDRAKPIKPKPSIFDTRFENIPIVDNSTNKRDNESSANPPVASPRLKRKGKVVIASGPDTFNAGPKIAADEQGNNNCVNGTGTNYLRMPNEPRPSTKEHNIKHDSTSSSKPLASIKSASQQANRFTLENQFANNSSQLSKSASFTYSDNKGSSSDIGNNMKMTTNYNNQTKASSNRDLSQQVEDEEDVPVATPRTRRKNNQNQQRDVDGNGVSHNQANFHDLSNTMQNQDFGESMDGDIITNTINGKPVSLPSNNLPKAVRFEPHVIKLENERKHNKGNTRTNLSTGGMRMNNNFNNKLRQHLSTSDDVNSVDHVDSPISSPQFTSDSPAAATNNAPAYHYNYDSAKSIYSFGGPEKSGKSTKKSNGFVARAIAKVKSKGKGKGKSNLISSNNNTKLRSISNFNSITYISPPPTETQQQQYKKSQQSESVIQEITLNPISLSSVHLNTYNNEQQQQSTHIFATTNGHNNTGVSRSESFTKAGILKNPSGFSENVNKSPPKPKRSSLKKVSNNMSEIPIPQSLEKKGEEEDGDHPLPSLTTDQLTPSSTSSSSSSSYLSNLQESYDLFHASAEECESIGDESEDNFKSFEDDEDAGEDFIFYSQEGDDADNDLKSKPSHPHQHPPSRNLNQIVNNNNLKERSRNYKEVLVGSGSASTSYHGKDASSESHNGSKGLKKQVFGNNDEIQHHQQNHLLPQNYYAAESTTTSEYYVNQEGVDYKSSLTNTTPNLIRRSSSTSTTSKRLSDPAILSAPHDHPEAKNSLNYNNPHENSDCINKRGEYFHHPDKSHLSEYHGAEGENREDFHNLLLPTSSFVKSATLPNKKSCQNYSKSEFFPGAETFGDYFGARGMSSLPRAPKPKFRSSVAINPDEKDHIPDAIIESTRRALLRSPSPTNEIPILSRGGKKNNVTTVDISGDVGIVNSNTASAFLNSRRAQLKKVNNESLWKNDAFSSGLSKLKSQQERDNSENNNNNTPPSNGNSHENYDDDDEDIKPHDDIEIGSSVSHNGSSSSSSSNLRKSVSSSDGEGSDWHSESTKNTVIFREFRGAGDEDSKSHSSTRSEGFNYDCDPEIHISSITVLDNEVTGSGVTTNSKSTTSNHVKKAKKVSESKSNKPAKSIQSSDDKERDNIIDTSKSTVKNVKSLDNSVGGCDTLIKGKQGAKSDVGHCIQELTESNEALTDFDDQEPFVQMPEEFEDMVQCHLEKDSSSSSKTLSSGSPNSKSAPRSVPNKQKSSLPKRRESPEGQEQEVPVTHPDDKQEENEKTTNSKKHLGLGEVIIMEKSHKSSGHLSKSKISQNALNQITTSSRSSPDGADAEKSEADSTTLTEPEGDSPTPMIEHFDVTSDEDSWVEEIIFEDDDTEIQMCRKAQPPPLDLTLHTIVEESCEESEPESGNFNNAPPQAGKQKRRLSSQQNDNELEKYFNFGINTGDNGSQGGRHSLTNDDSEFSDTFSESSFSMHDDQYEGPPGAKRTSTEIDPAELASTRLEKYFYNLGLPESMINPISSINQVVDSDSDAGSESESDNSVLEHRKKVLKHHRRSADFEDEFGDKVSDEDDNFGFGHDGFDTIKKTARKAKKGGSDSNLLESCGPGVSSGSKSSENILCSIANSTTTALGEHFSSPLSNNAKTPLGKTSSNETSSSKDESSSTSPTSPSASKKCTPSSIDRDRPVIKVNRSNSFQWSSDEEVNIMMSKLRQLIRNLVKSKTDQQMAPTSSTDAASKRGRSSFATTSPSVVDKDKQLAYLEGELIRLMKTENLKNIVEYFDSEESDVDDVYKFIRVVKESGSINSNADDNSDFGDIDLEDSDLLHTLHTTMQTDSSQASPKGSPALLAKVMHHIGNRLAVWMKDENMQDDDNNDDTVTLKCAQSVSSDLNEDRFSWKGSFESALAAKRQSVGSTDSISSSDFTQDRSILRSSSLHHLANSSHHLGQLEEEHKEEEETTSSLPRMTNLCNSLPRLNQPSNLSISRAHSLVMSGRSEEDSSPVTLGPIKSARYRPPGFQPVKSKRVDEEGKNNSPILSQSTPMLTQDSGHLKVRSDSMGSIFNDATKPHIVVKGQVEFGLQYNYKLACLEVRVKQCRNLAAVDTKRNRSDPYVKAYLLPDRSKSGKRKTKTKKNTLSPQFEEILKFPVTLSDLQNRTMWLSVWHSDIFGKNEFLGEVLVELKDRVFDDPNPQFWDLQEMSGETEDMPRGDMILALKWQPKTTESTGNLSVLIKEAKDLVPIKSGGIPSSFIKCSLLSDKSRKHKTSICRRSYNPVWNQTLSFEDAGDEGLEITLWNHDLLSNNELLGKVIIEYDNPLWASMLSRHSFWVEGILRLS